MRARFSSALVVAAFASVVSCSSSDDGSGGSPRGGPGTDADGGGSSGGEGGIPGRPDDGIKNADETDIDCGGKVAPKCAEGKGCGVDNDCTTAICSESKTCITVKSCRPHLGGDTCGAGEVGDPAARHESCCRTLPVPGFSDPMHPGQAVYLDKYEITVGRVRAWLADIAAQSGGKPDVKSWVGAHPPTIWDPAWNQFLPSDETKDSVLVAKNLLGDVRGQPDEPPVPDSDQNQSVGTNFQFNGQLYVYLHGNNCATNSGSYGFPTFFYPADVLAKTGTATFPPRADGIGFGGAVIPASQHLEVKAMNCITNAMLVAFCAWDGGQLATESVLDFVTDTPPVLGSNPGCGTQVGTEYPPTTDAATKGGRCADLALINATFDAGGKLPEDGSPLNHNNYNYPTFANSVTWDKAWEISAPGRGSIAAGGAQVDMVRINPGDEPWMDLAGNLGEAALPIVDGQFTGKFALKYRGIGYQSARSDLNTNAEWPGEGGVRRFERPEARAGFAGGRCMRFK